MPKRSKNSLFSQLLFHKRANLVMLVAFGLIFAGVGAFYVNNSFAATGCVAGRYGYVNSGFTSSGYCVTKIQQMINHLKTDYQRYYGAIPLGLNGVSVDGNYGGYSSDTSNNVKAFQTHVGISPDRIVGSDTWWHMCGELRGIGTRSNDASLFNDVHCGSFGAYSYW